MSYRDLGASGYPFKFAHDDATAGAVMVPIIIDGAPETLTVAAPAASVDVYQTVLDASANGVAATLADGKFHGQQKMVNAIVVAGGATTLTIASPFSAATNLVTFAAIGDAVWLIWNEAGQYWRILAKGNIATGGAGPTVA